MQESKRCGFIDAFTMKVIMAFLMVLDHLYYNLFPQELLWGHYAARVVAPMFCYLMTEGMFYTRNRAQYIRRMLLFGLGMLAGNAVLFALYGSWIQNSILMSLGLAAAMLACTDNAKAVPRLVKKLPWIGAAAVLFVVCLFFEGAYMVPVMGMIFYYLRSRPLVMWTVYAVVFCTPYILLAAMGYGLEPQFFMIFAFVPVLCYSGQRGISNTFTKYFFYVFYPLHIWIIFLIEQYVG